MFKSMQPKDWVKPYPHGTLPNTDFDMSIGNFTHTVYKYTNVIACNNERTEKFIIARKLSIINEKNWHFWLI